jgi:hypothetical protein
LGLGAVGCRNCDLVEAELRTRENEMRELKAELFHITAQNEALHREMSLLRQGGPALPPELAGQTCTIKQIVLGRQTGGYDYDDCPGDEALQVALEPRDVDDHTIKAPGALHVDALQIDPAGLKVPLCSWDVRPDQLRRTWRSGLLSTGYQVVLPWKTWPTTEKLRIVARFTLADGRVFEADKDVTIHLVPAAKRKPLPGPPLEEVTEPAGPGPQTRHPVLWMPGAGMVAVGQGELVRTTSLRQAAPLSSAVQLLRPVASK